MRKVRRRKKEEEEKKKRRKRKNFQQPLTSNILNFTKQCMANKSAHRSFLATFQRSISWFLRQQRHFTYNSTYIYISHFYIIPVIISVTFYFSFHYCNLSFFNNIHTFKSNEQKKEEKNRVRIYCLDLLLRRYISNQTKSMQTNNYNR